MNSSRNSFEMMCFSRFIILQSVVTRYLFVQKVVNCCTISCTLKIFSTGLNSQAHYRYLIFCLCYPIDFDNMSDILEIYLCINKWNCLEWGICHNQESTLQVTIVIFNNYYNNILEKKLFVEYKRLERHIDSLFYGECKIVCVNRYCMNLLYAPYWGKQR